MATYCEDYPCCGHTDGLGCDWTYTDEARAYDTTHAMCDHEAGICDVEPDAPDCCDGAADAFWENGDVLGTDHDPECDEYDGAPLYRPGMGPDDPVRCDND